MKEYIEKQAAIELAKDIVVPCEDGSEYRHRCIDPQDIRELPNADVRENVKGTWKIYCDDKGVVEDCYCDQCGFNSVIGGNYCPNCGADMRGVDNE